MVGPLAGGVSSDIHLVETAARAFCVKRALPRLKVAALWRGAGRTQQRRGGVDQGGRRMVARAAPRSSARIVSLACSR